MAQQVVIAGALFNDVPSISVPDSNSMYHPFVDPSVTTATASDVAQGKQFIAADGTLTQGTASGGGGASNVVTGTFTTVSTRATNGTVSLSYTGSGYPIVLLVYINGGVYNGTDGGNADYYNSVNRYDVGAVYITKAEMNTVPTYGTSGGNNVGAATSLYKNSTTNPATFASSSSVSTVAYNSGNAGNSQACVRFKGNGTTLSYRTGNKSSTSIGLVPSTEYAYIVIYSS